MTKITLIGGGLFAVGLALQLTLGPIDWSLFAAPVNWIMLGLLLGVLVLMFLLRKRVYALKPVYRPPQKLYRIR